MSFNRIKYDNTAFDLQMKRSTDLGDYRLFAPFAENCEQCISENGPVGSKSDVSLVKKPMDLTFGDMAEVECALGWRNTKLTKSNQGLESLNKELNHKPSCSKKLSTEDTRFTNPIDNFRGMSLTKFMIEPHLHVNPQCHIQEDGFRSGLNSRLKCKDSYKMPKQEFLDNGEVLPTPTAEEMPLQTNMIMS
jgi:hypothetical protein